MGKTQSGAVWLDPNKTSPFEFYHDWRNVADADVLKCLRMLTFLPLEQIDEMDQWEGSQLNKAKEILAYELTALVHGEEEAVKAQEAPEPYLQAEMLPICLRRSSKRRILRTVRLTSSPSFRSRVWHRPALRREEMWSREASPWTEFR